MEESYKNLTIELVTVKYMIYSIYKTVCLLEGHESTLDEIREWENECRELAKKYVNKEGDK